MDRLTRLSLVGLVAAIVAIGGCQNQQAAELQAAKRQAEALRLNNEDLQANLAKSETENADLTAKLKTGEAELAMAQNELARLKKGGTGLPPPPPPPPPRPIPAGWVRTSAGAKVVLSGDIFEVGKATLTKAGEQDLKKVAETLKRDFAAHSVRVYGHTDSDRVVKTAKLWQDNLDLSANRAMTVTRYLLAAGWPAAKVETVAMGEAVPLVPNRTAADKAKNRRVEIEVVVPP